MYRIKQATGLKEGGCNFDAKVRRQSIDAADLFYGHIAGIDTLARALLIGEKFLKKAFLQQQIDQRYAKWTTPLGQNILNGKTSLAELVQSVNLQEEPLLCSGKQEMLEAHINNALH